MSDTLLIVINNYCQYSISPLNLQYKPAKGSHRKALNRVGKYFFLHSKILKMKNLKLLVFILIVGLSTNANAQSNKVKVGESISFKDGKFIVSANGLYKALFSRGYIYIEKINADGSTKETLLSYKLYNDDGRSFFESAYLIVQEDGNLVAYSRGTALWSSDTNGRGGSGTHLQIQNDGNLVLYNGTFYGGDGDALWATGTCGGKENGCGSVGTR